MRYRTAPLLLLLSLLFLVPFSRSVAAQSAAALTDGSDLPRITQWMEDYAEQHAPEITARSALLLDAGTGAVLFEKAADVVIPPASLTKVVAMHVVFRLAEAGTVDLDEYVELPPESWAVNLPPGSSLMFLGPDQEVTVRDLLMGLAVPSGNDAAIALALHVSGSVPEFAELMTTEARSLGLPSVSFEEPSGLSAENRITAREFARFVQHYVTLWPQATLDYHSVTEFTWPREAPAAPEAEGVAYLSNSSGAEAGRVVQQRRDAGSITQSNRNSLLRSYPGVDGVKTGFIRQSRYNLAATAVREDRRLVAVVLGAPGESHAEGERNRARDATTLLDYGFDHFTNVLLEVPAAEPVRVWKGKVQRVELVADGPGELTVPASDLAHLRGELVQQHEVEAPLSRGHRLGHVAIHARERLLLEMPLYPVQEVPRGSVLRVVWDTIVRFVLQIAVQLTGG